VRHWALTLSILLIAGCAAPSVLPPLENPQRAWQLRQAQLLPLTTWNLVGRVALRSEHDGGQASLRWEHTPSAQTIDLSGPLGRGLVRLQQDEQGVRLLDSNQQVYQAENAEALLFNTTGWHIPLEGLNYWIRGVPVPDAPLRQELDDQGRLAVLWQLGWEVHFLSYTRVGAHDLPRRLTLLLPPATDTPESPPDPVRRSPVEARLVIERWTLLQ
jgi:outer membrane lipoprotein LolB